MKGKSSESTSTEPELVIERIFDAPRELVFDAWTKPEHIMQWWGPGGFTSPSCQVDLRPGGSFHFCMRSPDGKDYWNKGIYEEIVIPERIVSKMYFADEKGNIVPPEHYGMTGFASEMIDIVTFEVHKGNKTKLTIRRNHTVTIARKYGEIEGWNTSLDKLAAALTHL